MRSTRLMPFQNHSETLLTRLRYKIMTVVCTYLSSPARRRVLAYRQTKKDARSAFPPADLPLPRGSNFYAGSQPVSFLTVACSVQRDACRSGMEPVSRRFHGESGSFLAP